MKAFFQKFPVAKIYLVEIPLFFLAFELVEIYLHSLHMSLGELSPHPYWLVVISLALMYGPVAGIVTGIIAGGLTLNWAELKDIQPMELMVLAFSPFAFVSGGALLGFINRRQKNLISDNFKDLDSLHQQIEDIETDRQRLIEANLNLEKKVVSREDTILTLYEASKSLGSLQKEQIFQKIPVLLKEYLRAQACSFYLHQEDQLMFISQIGWHSLQEYPDNYNSSSPLYQQLIRQMRILMPQDLRDIDNSIMVSPLIDQNKHLYGMIKIEKLSFLELNASTAKMLEILADWMMRAIDNAWRFSVSQERQIRDPLTETFTYAYFKERLQREIRLTQRYKLKTALTLVKIVRFQDMTETIQNTVLSIVARILLFQFRDEDLVARVEFEDYQFAIIQPYTEHQGANVAIMRCLRELIGFEFKPFEDNDFEVLLLEWNVLESQDQSLFNHPLVWEIQGTGADRFNDMIANIAKQAGK
ncbi:MAG: GAF domain-containing protein [SAR324 cluster bacterium]|nr:GAF domain-containing protein [SAR324 cluster bacterium]MBF0352879.1 GAF domain-containing protein [SAR324 cluster bacterium]